jgi:RNA polymerase sigma factor (sigma-70 family)
LLTNKSQGFDDESRRLGRLFHNGNRQAGLDLLNLHLPLAYSIAERYSNMNPDKDSTRQNACAGLWTAITLYDPERINAFSTYAGWWIRHHIHYGLRGQGPVRVPPYVRTTVNAVNHFIRSFYNRRGVKPSGAEIAAEFGITEDDLISLHSCEKSMSHAGHVALDDPGQRLKTDDSDNSLNARYSEARGIARRVLKNGILLFVISEKERIILSARYGLFGHEILTYREIAKMYGFSRSKALNIERIALRKLREHIVRSSSKREEQRS